ncbi:MAG: hypothetical protein PWQ83_1900 [Thermosipho sp. (in: thermotogales)]|jgi:hypothetical protein|nr:hypothetical protein [Thermosipho sp. (in: thermotogales)]
MNVDMVENLVKYVENNYFLLRVEFKSFDILNMEGILKNFYQKSRFEAAFVIIFINKYYISKT